MSKKVNLSGPASSSGESAPPAPSSSPPLVPVVSRQPSGRPKERRFTAARKAEAAQRLLRGETIDALSRELGVTAATLSSWRDKFLAAGQAALKSRAPTSEDEEVLRLKAMVGELAMRNELLIEKTKLLEAASPFPWRRSRG